MDIESAMTRLEDTWKAVRAEGSEGGKNGKRVTNEEADEVVDAIRSLEAEIRVQDPAQADEFLVEAKRFMTSKLDVWGGLNHEEKQRVDIINAKIVSMQHRDGIKVGKMGVNTRSTK